MPPSHSLVNQLPIANKDTAYGVKKEEGNVLYSSGTQNTGGDSASITESDSTRGDEMACKSRGMEEEGDPQPSLNLEGTHHSSGVEEEEKEDVLHLSGIQEIANYSRNLEEKENVVLHSSGIQEEEKENVVLHSGGIQEEEKENVLHSGGIQEEETENGVLYSSGIQEEETENGVLYSSGIREEKEDGVLQEDAYDCSDIQGEKKGVDSSTVCQEFVHRPMGIEEEKQGAVHLSGIQETLMLNGSFSMPGGCLSSSKKYVKKELLNLLMEKKRARWLKRQARKTGRLQKSLLKELSAGQPLLGPAEATQLLQGQSSLPDLNNSILSLLLGKREGILPHQEGGKNAEKVKKLLKRLAGPSSQEVAVMESRWRKKMEKKMQQVEKRKQSRPQTTGGMMADLRKQYKKEPEELTEKHQDEISSFSRKRLTALEVKRAVLKIKKIQAFRDPEGKRMEVEKRAMTEGTVLKTSKLKIEVPISF